MYGYVGKILRVNLTTGQISEEFPDEKTLQMFLGGAGLATKYLYDEVPKGIDPLGHENKLIFMTGPMTGTSSPSTGRYSVVAKSPLTGFWGHANSGGFWGRDLKRSGFDGIIFEGKSEKPVYFLTHDGKTELRDASHLWGKNTSETTRILREELGDKFNVACIGVGGENLVKYAAIMNDADHPNWGRAAGRCGMGAVMGSKRLKAIVSGGISEILVADKVKYKEEAKNRFDWVNQSLLKMTLEVYGTAAMLDLVSTKGGFPTRNWQTGVFKDADNINGEAINENILVKRKPCFSCPIHCGRISEIKTGPYRSKGEGPEYESLCSLGSMCDINNLEAITYAHFLCNEYGIDTISAGSTISFSMECYEKGILTDNETGGLKIKFGDHEVMVELIHKIATRDGIGDLLAEGTKAISKKLGKGSEDFAMHVKGLELPAYDSRAAKVTGLSFATANRGGDHMTSFIEGPTFLDMPFLLVEDAPGDPLETNTDDAKIVKEYEDAFGVFDSIGGCKFMGMVLTGEDWAELIATLFGWEDFTEKDFRTTGERIYTLQRIYNLREGLTRADDTLPGRLLKEPLPEGPAKGHTVNLEPLLDAYYEFRDWDFNGIPKNKKIKELGLDWLIPDLENLRKSTLIKEREESRVIMEPPTVSKAKELVSDIIDTKLTYSEKPWLKSYKVGPYSLPKTMEPYPEIPVHKFLDDSAQEFPDNIAYTFIARDFKEELTYMELKLKVDKFATALSDLGVKKGDRVATILPTCPQFIICDYAIMKLGAVHVPLSILHKETELLHEIRESNTENLICSFRRLKYINTIKDKIKIKHIIYTSIPIFPDYSLDEVKELPNLENLHNFEDLIDKYDPNPPIVEINPKEDLALLPFTGGTTGIPKGTMLTHYNITTNVIQSFQWIMQPLKEGIKGKASGLICLPIFHQAGHFLLHSGISWGLRAFLIDGRDLSLIVQIINKYRPFIIGGVPTHYMMLLENPALQKMPCFFFSGAAALPQDVATKWEHKVGTPLSEGYGMTEATAVTHMNPSGLSKVTGFMPQVKYSVGIPVVDTEVKIVDPETNQEAPFGHPGELWIRGPQIMKGYWPTLNNGLQEDGWLKTGDIGKMDKDGYFYIVDRIKDMINVSGMKVYSQTVDDVLYKHPAVILAGVIGIPDPNRPGSERVKAFIVLKEDFKGKITEEEIILHCKNNLPPYAVPTYIEFRESLPLTNVLKLHKKKLRDEEFIKQK